MAKSSKQSVKKNVIPVPPQSTHEIKGSPKNKTVKLERWWNNFSFVPLTRVSRIHLYEARERYFNLMELIRYHARLLGLNLPDYENEDFDFPEDIRKLEREISQDNATDEENKKEIFSLLSCYETLIDTRRLLTRKQGDLNRIWRALTRVRSRINKIITTSDMQSSQLYFCQEEAYRLDVDDDPSIKTMLQDLAEAIDNKGVDTAPRYTCTLHALFERFNTIRTGRIHQQFINIRTYWIAFTALMIISFLLIQNYDVILNSDKNPASNATVVQEAATQDETPNSLSSILQDLKNYLKQNMLAFIFLGGLTGGFFSVTTRERSRDFIPGEDAYYTAYILTKPFIGALGAIILYILIHGGFVTQEIFKGDLVGKLKEPGPVSFGFALISGFSERVVFPKFR